MTESMTETPTTPTEGTTSSEAAVQNLLSSSETAATTQQQQREGQRRERFAATEKSAEETEPVDKSKSAEEAKPVGPPETYEFKAPEGREYDNAVLEPFAEAAREANLSQDAAQKLLDRMAPALAARQQEQVTAVRTGWLEASRTDKEFGGERLQENLSAAKKALDSYAAPGFRKLLEDTGLGSHPEVIRMLVRVGKGMNEDSFVAGGGAFKGPRDLAAKLYPNTPS